MNEDFDDFLSDIGEGEAETVGLDKTSWLEETSDCGDLVETNKPASESETEQIDLSQIPSKSVPQIIGEIPSEFQEVVKSIQFQYYCLPVLDYGKIYEELSDLAVESSPSPTLQMINDEIQKIQASKDRLSEILREVDRNYYFKKLAVDLLEKAYPKYSSEKSADKRKSESVAKISHFLIDFANTDACFRACCQVLKNLDSSHESLSKRVYVNQQLLKMHDYGRGQLPDHDFVERPDNDDPNAEINTGNVEIDEENF